MRCERCSGLIGSTINGAVLCPACLLADVRVGRPDAAWMRARFPQLQEVEAFPEGDELEVVGVGVLRFHARDFESENRVVLHLIQTEQVARLLGELEKRSHLEHPGITQLHDYGELDGFVYAIEALPAGEPLSSSIREADVSRTDMLGFLPQITDATRYAASQGVILPSGPEAVYIGSAGEVIMTGLPEDGERGETDATQWIEEHPTVGTRIGRYELRELLGEGGFAEVYRALQERPVRREVALKILKLGMDTRQVLARFAMERQALAQMAHSGIARIYDAGATGAGRPYIAMELVEGGPITSYCDEELLSLNDRARLMILVCRAVDHGHTKGVIHRDLKPSNVLVVEEDGSPVPKVIDFGIARAAEEPLTSSTFFTRTQQFIGSPSYMSPEQVDGSVDVDVRSDVYSLGCLLYELLVGEPPLPEAVLAEGSLKDVIDTIQGGRVQHPADRVAEFSRERKEEVAVRRSSKPKDLVRVLTARGLSDIALKALSAKPASRYESATAFADDLEGWIEEGRKKAPRCRRQAIYRYKKAAVWVLLFMLLAATAWYHSPLGRRMPTSRSADGTLSPVALFQFSGSLESAIPDGPDMEATGDPELSYETVEIGGEEAEVLHFPRFDPKQWLKVENVIGVNGPWNATETNRWTLVFDVMFPEVSGPMSLFQCHSENAGNSELHVGPGGFGSRFGLNYGFVREGEWNRIVVTSSDNGRAQYYAIYINGTRLGIPWVKGVHSASFAFDDEILLFCEGDNRTGEGYLNSFAVYDLALTDAEVRALGVPRAAGIPAEFRRGPARRRFGALIAEERVVPVSGTVEARFGSALAMDRDEVWVSSPHSDVAGANAGEVRSYRADSGGRWKDAGKVEFPEDMNGESGFGTSLAMRAARAVVGAPGVFGGGAAYLYRREAGAWSSPTRLVSVLSGELTNFGMITALSSETVVVSGTRASGKGAVFFFDGDSGKELQMLDSEVSGENGLFGSSMAAGEEHLAIALPNGGVGIYARNSSGRWEEESRIRASLGSSGESPFARRLAMTSDGAWLATSWGGGRVDIYHRAQGKGWVRHAKLTEPNSGDESGFGEALAFSSSSRLLVGAPDGFLEGVRSGTVLLYDYLGASWELGRIIAPAIGSLGGKFGSAVAVSGDRLWVGSAEDHTDRFGGGAAYPLSLPRFEEQRFPTLSPALTSGADVAISDDLAAVGVPGIDHRAYGGEFQIFQRGEDDVWSLDYRTPEAEHTKIPNSSYRKVALGEGRLWTSIGGELVMYEKKGGVWGVGERVMKLGIEEVAFDRGKLLLSSSGILEWSSGRLDQFEAIDRPESSTLATSSEMLIHGDLIASMKSGGGGGVSLMRKEAAGWVEARTLAKPAKLAPGSRFGNSLDHDERWVVVGAPVSDWKGDGVGAGAAFVYDLENPDRAPVLLSCPEVEEMPAYGWSVVVSGDVILVSNPYVHRGLASGRVYLYRYDSLSARWLVEETLLARNAESGDEFGINLAVDDGWAVIGAKSSWVYLFRVE